MTLHRVLLIDDEEDIRVLIGVLLETDGRFHVSTADSGECGIATARREQPQVILLDYSMPDADGPEVFHRLRADDSTRAIPVIFLTGKAHGDTRAAVEAVGADGVISKPVDPASFADSLASLLGRIERAGG